MKNPFFSLLARTDFSVGYPVGTWIMSASPVVAEAVGCAGFDWAVVDMEHTPLDQMEVVHVLQAIAGTPMVPVTRVPWNDTVMVKRVLDAGVQTVLFPFVQDGDEARRAVAATKYAPEGVRGMAAMSRGSRFGTVKDYFKVANDGIGVIVQIESPYALERLEEIASVPGVDALFIGPGDLSGAMGHVGDLMHPDVLAAIGDAVRRCHAVGKPIGTVGGTPDAVATYRAMGFDFLACASDLGLLMRNCASTLSAIRSQDIQIHSQGY